MPIDHDALREAVGLYVLGALDPGERAALEAHLAGCAECTAEVRTLRGVTDALLFGVPQVEPAPALRDRVLAAVATASRPDSRSTSSVRPFIRPASPVAAPVGASAGLGRGSWLAMAALLVLTVGLGIYGTQLRQRVGDLEARLQEAANRLDRTEQQLAVATRTAESAQVRMAVLTAPDLRQVNLAGQPVAPRAAGRGFWSRSRGLVFAATELPQLPAGRTYQLWYLTANAPVSAGLFAPDSAGTTAGAFDPPPADRTPTGLAVSLEPEGGVPAPTGAIYLAGNTQ